MNGSHSVKVRETLLDAQIISIQATHCTDVPQVRSLLELMLTAFSNSK